MKNYLSLIFSVVLLCSMTVAGAQQVKIGHINSQELLASMPASDSAQKKLEKIAQEHELVLEEMTVEFNKKFEAYRKAISENTMSDLTRATREAELEDLQNRISTFEQTAQQDLQQKRMEIFQPVQEAALGAVNDVAEENGFTYIFDSGMGAIVYTAPNSEDILPLVKTKLGIQ